MMAISNPEAASDGTMAMVRCTTTFAVRAFGIAPSNRFWTCLGQAAEQNGVALALDTAAVATDFAGPEAQYARLAVEAGISTASIINSAATQDGTGTVLGLVSYNRAAAEFAGTAAEFGWAKWVPVAGALYDFGVLGRDAISAASGFAACRAGG